MSDAPSNPLSPSRYPALFAALPKLLGVAVLYALLAKVVLAYFSANGVVSIVWPPSGLALAVLLIGGKRYFPGVFLGAFLANAMAGLPFGTAAAIAVGNTLEALLGVWLLARCDRFDPDLRAMRDYLCLIVRGGFVACSVAALNGSTVLLLSGFLDTDAYFQNLLHWWMGDALGIVLVTPLILAWRRLPDNWLEPERTTEALLMLVLALLIGQTVFLGWLHDIFGQVAKGYWMFLFIAWSAMRLGIHGVVTVVVIVAIQALMGVAMGTGYFADDIAQTGLANYWFYMLALSVVGMTLATHFTERKQLEQQLARRLRHRDVMERISRISLSSASIEELLGRVLDEMLTVFKADRVWFLYPCDPDAPSWSVPMERTRPEWPGAFARGMVIPMTPEVAGVFREVLASRNPLPYGPAAPHRIPAAITEQFSVQSQIQMALHPRVGAPWTMGLHHCAKAHAYDEDELQIFKDIGRRVADSLSSMIILNNLRESEMNLNHAQAVGQVGSWHLDIPANRLKWSAETCRIFGLPQQGAVNPETFIAAIHPDDRDLVLKAWGDAMAGAPYDIEHRIVVNGETRWVRERAEIERDSGGKPLVGIGTVQEITERRKMEEELRILAAVVEQSPLSVAITDLDANIRYINPHFMDATGYSGEEAIGQNPRILQSGLTTKAVYTELWDSLTSGRVWRGELVNKRKNGELYWEEAHIAPVLDSAGIATHYAAVKLEITQRKQAERELAESEERFRLLVESSPFCIHEIDLEGRFLSMNRAGLNMLGLGDVEDIRGKPCLGAVSQQEAGRIGGLLRDAIANGTSSHFEFAAAGEVRRYFKSCFIPIRDADGKVLKIMGITEDITERKASEERLRQSEANQRAILNSSPYLVWLKDIEGRYVKVNRAYAEYVRLSDTTQAIGKTDFDFWPKVLAEKYRADDAAVIASRQQKHIEEPSLDGDRMHWVETFKTPVIDENGNLLGTTGFSRDITERKQAEEQIHMLAFYDALTHLPNRRLLNDRLGQTMGASKRSGRYCALMFLDLDNFKPLNDAYGHDVGDLLLIEAARRITGCVRETDTVARFGGDEFVVMLSELDADKVESAAEAGTVAEKVRAALAEPYLLRNQPAGKEEIVIEHHCTSSIGVVLFINHEASPEEILKWADMAMYQAKESGRNQIRLFGTASAETPD